MIDLYLGLLDWLFLLYGQRLKCIALCYGWFCVKKLFCGLALNYNLVVCGTPNLTELCYFLAYKECFSI